MENAQLNPQMNKIPSSVEEIPSSTDETLRNMRATMEEYMSSASERAREAAAYADRTVQHNPWTAVGIGFGVGMMFGALVAMLAARSSNHTVLDHLR
jgi:ElaB/YqjD/DUF883 family membrane-anchored ribosome-binding protein